MIDFAQVKPLSFAAPPPDPTARAKGGIVTRAARRRFVAIQEAAEALKIIPEPGETVHTLMSGSWDLMHGLIVLLDKLASPCLVMRIATLSLSAKNVSEMVALLDAGKVKKLDLLASDFWRKHDSEICNLLLSEFAPCGQRVATARSHAKLVTMALEDGRRLTIESSANLRTNKNTEFATLTAEAAPDAPLHRFWDTWISDMVTRHEIHES